MRTEIAAAPLKSSGEEFSPLECRLQESYRRSEAMGVPRDAERIIDILDSKKLNSLLNTHVGLISHATLLFTQAFQSLDNKQALFVLTDAQARILALNSHLTNVNTAAQKGVCVGTSLSEASIGTNSVSLALHGLEGAVVRGPQHFSRLFQGCHGISVPILGSNGRPIGCVNISTADMDSMDMKLALMSFIAKDVAGYCVRNAIADTIDVQAVEKSITGSTVRITERQRQVLELFSPRAKLQTYRAPSATSVSEDRARTSGRCARKTRCHESSRLYPQGRRIGVAERLIVLSTRHRRVFNVVTCRMAGIQCRATPLFGGL
jgi:transcriptional regulator of acetoin/glycerol metabolism